MDTQLIQLPWVQADWFARASAWIECQLHQQGRAITAPIELVHQRPWSAFARVTTDQGLVYFKAPAPMFAYEAPLIQALAQWRPDCNVPVLAIDQTNGWILSANAGTTLRLLDRTEGQIAHWQKILPLYSELQITLADRVPELLALGLPDRRLAQLPQQYADLLTTTESLRIGLKDGLAATEYARLQAGQAHFAAQCEALAAYHLPETITHEEVHENNVLLGSDGRYIFTDWSDCSISHPFFSMLVTLRATAHWLQLDEQGPEIQQLRDAYLEPWTIFAPHSHLNETLALAYRLGMVNRALSWEQSLGRLSTEDKGPYADSVPGWLQDYLQAEAQVSSGS
jgi:Phosphotransferase enzyme family